MRLLISLASALFLGIGAVCSGCGSTADHGGSAAIANPNAAQRTYALLLGIPQHRADLGYPNAPVTLQFFGDLQCKQARQVMLGALPFLIRHWIRAGQLQIRFRSKETDTRSAGGWFEFREQQSAALAAGQQGKLWNFIDVFYRLQGPEFTGYVDESFLERIAVQAGVNLDAWRKAREPETRWVGAIEADGRLHDARHLYSTPSFLIGPTGGRARPLRRFSLEDPRLFDEAVEAVLRRI
jgi:hypothetical protein